MNKKFDLKKFFLNPWVFFFGGWLVLSLIIGGVFWLINNW